MKRLYTIGAMFVLAMFLSCAGLLTQAKSAMAADALQQSEQSVEDVATAAGVGPQQDLLTIIGRIINIALGLVGIILLGLLLYSGYQYMTAGGDAEKIKNAVARIKNAIIGLIIIVFSFAIVNFIMGWLTGSNSGLGGVGSQWQPPGGFSSWQNSGSLGQGVIENHFPERDQRDVPRNTAIAITFKEPVDPASFAAGWTEGANTPLPLNDAMVKIHPQQAAQNDLPGNQLRVTVTADKMTVIIKPNEPLGNAQTPTWYEVVLTGGRDGIKNASGTALFLGSFSDGYAWDFEVSTQIDNTPPRVLARIPTATGIYARNVMVQVYFNEPMMPISVSGFYDQNAAQPFINITATNEKTSDLIPGEYRIANGYKTVVFLPAEQCGKNSCGMDMYCLPASTPIRFLVKAATLSGTPPLAAELGAFGFDGAVDMAGNSLDGNNNSVAEGQGNDDYHPEFAFTTTDQIRRDGPRIADVEPEILQGQVGLDAPAKITWAKDDLLLAYTANSSNISISRAGAGEKQLDDNTWWFGVGTELLNEAGQVLQPGEVPASTQVIVKHRPFMPSEVPNAQQNIMDTLNVYAPSLNHNIMNMYQNCFTPAKSELIQGQIQQGNNNLCNETATDKPCQNGNTPNWIKLP